jgi:hypothetical protein
VAAVHALAPEFTPDDHPLHLFSQRDLVINFAQTRRGTLRYIFLPSPTAALSQAPVTERLVALPPEKPEERPMTNLLPFFPSAAFDHNATRAMGKAFDRACHSLHDIGQPDLV